MKRNVFSFALAVVMLLCTLPLGVFAESAASSEDAAFDILLETVPNIDGTVTVKLTPQNFADGILPIWFVAELYYDSDKLELKNGTLSSGAIDCVTKQPSSKWENMTVVKRDSETREPIPGALDIFVGTAGNDFITADAPLALSFTFEFKGDCELAEISIPAESVNVCDTNFAEYYGNGASVEFPRPETVDFVFEILDNGEARLKNYYGNGGDVVIPNEYNGCAVTSIKKRAFQDCSSLMSVIIPDSVTSIGDGTFYGCTSLTDIYCEAPSQPEGWDEGWLEECNATVHWGWNSVSYGDVNGDGMINGKDATRLMQYLAHLDYQTGISDIAVSSGADCNGDGVIDGRDSVRLLRYLANFNATTGESDVPLGPNA